MADFSRHYQIRFHDPELLRLALTHRSYLSVSGKSARESNERLEFLGDSVLGLVTSEFLYRAHPNEHEGQLTKTKSLLVSKAILSRRALAMGLGRFVFMSHSEVESGGRQRLSILADGFESVVGAIYLDQGFEPARKFIHDWLLREASEIAADKRHTNYKSHLQEYVQSTFRTHPVYRIRSEMGPDHSKQFMVDVLVGRRVMGSGKGRNKKEAEQAAARDALEKANHRVTEQDDDRDRSDAIQEDEGGELVTGARRRRSRRGGRRRHADDEIVESGGESRDDTDDAPESPAKPEAPRRATREFRAEDDEDAPRLESRRPEPGRGESTRHESERPRRSAPWLGKLGPEYDEIGRPEGPLEELHVDPYAISDEEAESIDPAPTSFGRSVTGPRQGSPGSLDPMGSPGSAEDDTEEHSLRPERRTPMFPGATPLPDETEYGSAPEADPAPGDLPETQATFGRRPGRRRR